MRYTSNHKTETHERIVESAAALFREQGYNATGIKAIMEASGLTVGGFYSHFASKESLLAETFEKLWPMTEAMVHRGNGEAPGTGAWVAAMARSYLSPQHRDNSRAGCPLPALSSEIPRVGGEAQAAFEAILGRFVDEISEHMPDRDDITRREQALGFVAVCAGALMLARAVQSPALSDEFLTAAQHYATPPASGEDDAPSSRP